MDRYEDHHEFCSTAHAVDYLTAHADEFDAETLASYHVAVPASMTTDVVLAERDAGDGFSEWDLSVDGRTHARYLTRHDAECEAAEILSTAVNAGRLARFNHARVTEVRTANGEYVLTYANTGARVFAIRRNGAMTHSLS